MELEKVGLFAAGMVVFVWLAPRALSFVMGGAAMMAVPRSRLGDARQPAPRAIAPPAPGSGFSQHAVEKIGGDWERAAAVNATLDRLRGKRSETVARTGDSQQDKISWKLAVSSQTALYRLVAMAEATTMLWNAENPIGAALSALSVLEGAACLADFEKRVAHLTAEANWPALDALVMAATFANPLAEADPATAIASEPANALAGHARIAHAQLLALTEVQSLQQYRLFGTLDKTSTAVSFREAESFDKAVLDQILTALECLGETEDHLNRSAK